MLENIKDDRIRSEGIRWLDIDVELAFCLLSKNVSAGDEEVMHRALISSGESKVDPHAIGLDIITAAHETAIDASHLLKWTYEKTPCSLCRNSAVSELIKRSASPTEMLHECLWDCDPDTRAIAKAALVPVPTFPTGNKGIN